MPCHAMHACSGLDLYMKGAYASFQTDAGDNQTFFGTRTSSTMQWTTSAELTAELVSK